MLQQAVHYRELGLAPIPLRERSKEPYLSHLAPFLETPMTRAQMNGYAWEGIGIVTGKPSGIVVLDVDEEDGEDIVRSKGHPITPTVHTGKGMHLYFKHPGGHLPSAIRFMPGLDLKGDGGYVVAPPSTHPNGHTYQWVQGLSPWSVGEFAAMPDWLFNALYKHRKRSNNTPATQLAEPIAEGGRNETMTQVAGALRARGMPREIIYTVLESVNARWCNPPLEEAELARIANNIARYPAGRKKDRIPRSARVTVDVSFSGDDEVPVF